VTRPATDADRRSPTGVRRLPAPAWDPPYDDEVGRSPGLAPTSSSAAVQGTLALAFVLPSGVPAVPEVPPAALAPPLRLVSGAAADDVLDEVEFGPQPTPRAALPEPRGWAGRFVQAVVEVLAGDRPAAQLVRWTTMDVYDQVTSRMPAQPRDRAAGPARATVRSVHVYEPADGVAEVSALVRRGIRCTAIALRLEGMDGRWQCTALEVG
jgi:hypothetical protein